MVRVWKREAFSSAGGVKWVTVYKRDSLFPTSTISPPFISWMWQNLPVLQTILPPSILTVHWGWEGLKGIRKVAIVQKEMLVATPHYNNCSVAVSTEVSVLLKDKPWASCRPWWWFQPPCRWWRSWLQSSRGSSRWWRSRCRSAWSQWWAWCPWPSWSHRPGALWAIENWSYKPATGQELGPWPSRPPHLLPMALRNSS